MKEQASRIFSWGPRTAAPPTFPSTGYRTRAASGLTARLYSAIGLLGGIFGGLLGIGGGSAIAPLLLLVGTLRPAQIAGTTLATVLVISAVGSGAYASLGHVDFGLVWPIAVGSVAGSVLGPLSARRVSTRLMVTIFLTILPYFAVKEFWPSLGAPDIASTGFALAVLGFATGYVGGLIGVGGASILVPSLVGFFLIDHHAAQGIAIAVALADSAAGVATHARAGNINYRVLAYLAPPALIAALAAAFLSHSLPSSVLRNLFGAFVVAIWLMMLARFVWDFILSRTVQEQPVGLRVSRGGDHMGPS